MFLYNRRLFDFEDFYLVYIVWRSFLEEDVILCVEVGNKICGYFRVGVC